MSISLDPYALSIEIGIGLSSIYLRRIILFVCTIETSSLAVQLFKVRKNLSDTIMGNIFPARVLNYSLRSKTDFFRNTVNTAKLCLNSLRYFASKIWSMILIEIKNPATVEMFKSKISNWEPNNSDCKLCQVYLHRIGYINLVDE